MTPAVDLTARWARDVSHLPNPDFGLGQGLISAYSEPHRRYHGLGHLRFLFGEAERLANMLAEPDLVHFAIWFHDAIYDPAAKDNEARSAEWACAGLARMGANAELISRIDRLIRQTSNHAEGVAEPDAALFLDMDLAILGAPPSIYDRYAVDTRTEYGFVPDALWQAGRGAFLRQVLARPRIFRTDVYEATLASVARTNMARELAELGAG